jgi:hypothetical protein
VITGDTEDGVFFVGAGNCSDHIFLSPTNDTYQ